MGLGTAWLTAQGEEGTVLSGMWAPDTPWQPRH